MLAQLAEGDDVGRDYLISFYPLPVLIAQGLFFLLQ
jgi:hypothetical protein